MKRFGLHAKIKANRIAFVGEISQYIRHKNNNLLTLVIQYWGLPMNFVKKTPLSLAIAATAVTSLSAVFLSAPALADEPAVLEEIIVTAQKREQNIQDIAASVNVVTGSAISDYNLLDFSELENVTTGLSLTRTNARNKTLGLRGLRVDPESGAQPAVDIYVNGAQTRADVAFNQMFDLERIEVLRGPQGALQGRTSPAGSIQIHTKKPDLDEVGGYVQLQYGSNDATNFQGAVNLPIVEGKLALRIAALTDENDGQEIVNIVTGNVQDQRTNSSRISLAWSPDDTFNATFVYDKIKSDVNDAKPLAGSRSGGACLAAPLINPAAAVTCRAISVDQRLAAAPTDDFSIFEGEIYNFSADWALNDNHTLSYIFSYNESSKRSRQENDASNGLALQVAGLAAAGTRITNNFQTFQQTNTMVEAYVHELRIASNSDSKWQYMVGAYSDKTDTLTPFTSFTAIPFLPFTAAFPPAALTAPIPANPAFGLPGYDLTITGGAITGSNFSTTGDIPVDSETTAIFTHHTYELTDQTTLELGVRYTDFERFNRSDILFGEFIQRNLAAVQGLTATSSIPLPAAVVDPTAAAVANGFLNGFLGSVAATNIAGVSDANDTASDNALTGLFAIRHAINDNLNVYASYGIGYRTGGISIVPVGFDLSTANVLLYQPEDSSAVEFGFKATLLDGRATLNGAVFNQQLDNHFGRVTSLQANRANIPNDTNGQLANLPGGLVFNGDATVRGVELEGQYLVSDNFRIGGGLTYVNAEWDSALAPCNDRSQTTAIVATCDISGQRIAGEPSVSFNFNSEYTFPLRGELEGFFRNTYKYKGSIISTAAPLTPGVPSPEVNAYSVLNLYLGVRSESWEANVWAKNAFDEEALTDLRNPGAADNFDTARDFSQILQIAERTVGVTLRYEF